MEGTNTSKDGNTAGAGKGGAEPRTFTQDDVNAIVADRLKREREKYADYDTLKDKASKYDQSVESNKSELQKATEAIAELKNQLSNYTKAESIRKIREKVSSETKVPVSLLTGEDEEKCKEQAEAILAFAKPKEYPGTKPNSAHHKETGKDTDESVRDFVHQIFGKGE